MNHAGWCTASALSLLTAACSVPQPGPDPLGTDTIPDPPREFRAAWVATVANIDWPSEPGLSVAEQQAEAISILDRLVELNMNAVVFQVRPHADALYESELEPWSSYLTGEQGRAPEPYYDPLRFWIDEAHARGIVLHAWFNPYRANHPSNRGGLASNALVRARPELVVALGDEGYAWMDPALPAVQDHSLAVVLDVVRRYDVDGVHFDDYFYPYPSYNDGADFPDDASWSAYREAGGTLERGSWRRKAVDDFIARLHREIPRARTGVAFGISPFGIWRPGHPPSIRGLDQYDVLYADAKRWFNEGWVDYLTPQLYWTIAAPEQSFPVLLGWWSRENPRGRHLWPGTSVGRRQGEAGGTEIVNQVYITRGIVGDAPGMCFFSMRSLQREDSAVTQALADGPFAEPALIPPTPWLDDTPPAAPRAHADRLADGVLEVTWEPRGDEPVFRWVVAVERAGSWEHRIVPAATTSTRLEPGAQPITRVAVSGVDRLGNLSAKAVVAVGP